MGSDHQPFEISIDAQPHMNTHTHTNLAGYKFDQTNREAFESTLKAALSSGDVPELNSTQDIDKYADFIVTAISTAVDKAIPTYKSRRPESQPVSEESLVLIREKHRLRQQYSQTHDPLVKTSIIRRLGGGGGGSESMDGWGCAILALEVVPKNLIFT